MSSFRLSVSDKKILGHAIHVFSGSDELKKSTWGKIESGQYDDMAWISVMQARCLALIISAKLKYSSNDLRQSSETLTMPSIVTKEEKEIFLVLGMLAEKVLQTQRANWGIEAYEETVKYLLEANPGDSGVTVFTT